MSDLSEPIPLDDDTLRPTEVSMHTAVERPVEKQPITGKSKRTADTAYEIRREIARGGMGVVYEARDRDLGRTVALKIMRGAAFANPEEIGRFRAETEAAARLDHPNIVPVYEVGEMQGQPFFTMKLIEGGCIADLLKSGPLAAKEAARHIIKVARAVQHAHERGVLHRDLKPANVLIDTQGEPFLTDFGVAKFAGRDSGFTLPGDIIGTTEYMAPEQTRGDQNSLTTACDVWALGVLLYQMLSNRLPFTGENQMQIIRAIVQDEPASLGKAWGAGSGSSASGPGGQSTGRGRTVDRDLATIVARCLEKDVARRMPGAGFLADELERWLAGEPIRSRHVTPAERVWKWVRRYPLQVATVAAILISIFAGSVVSFVLWRQAQNANVSLNAANESLSHTNEELARSLRLSKATHLASESRVQAQEDATLGVLLAVESAETTRRVDGTVLPESASALLNAVQQFGGVDATASRGMPEDDLGYWTFARGSNFVRASPDGRWAVMIDFTTSGIIAALYDMQIPLSEEPRRRWFLSKAAHLDVVPFEAAWTADSRKLLTIDSQQNELREWDVLDQVEKAAPVVALGEPPVRSLGFPGTKGLYKMDARFLRDAGGEPSMLVFIEQIDRKADFLRWQTLDRSAAEPLGTVRTLDIDDGPYNTVRHKVRASPDGRWMLWFDAYSPSRPVLVNLADAAAPSMVLFPKQGGILGPIAYSKDGRWMAVGWTDGLIRLYDLNAGTPKAVMNSGVTLFERGNSCESLVFSPDGKRLVAAGHDSLVQVLDVGGPMSANPIQLRVSGRIGFGVAFTPDGQWLAMGGEDRIVNLWPVSKLGQAPRPIEFRGLSSAVIHVEFSADGQIMTALGLGGECRRWVFNGTNPGAMPICSRAGADPIKCMAASPDGKWLAAAPQPTVIHGGQTGIRLLDLTAGLEEYSLPGHVAPSGVAFSPDGRWFASTGRDALVRVWDVPSLTRALKAGETPKPAYEFQVTGTRTNFDRRLAFHPKGRLYCTCGDGFLFEWDLTAPEPETTLKAHLLHSIRYFLPDVAVSLDGKWLAVARHGNDGKPKEGHTQVGNMVLLYDVTNPDVVKPALELRAHFRDWGVLAFSGDSRWLGTGAQDGFADIWDLKAADIAASARSAPVSAPTIAAVTFAPAASKSSDRPWFALGGLDGRLHLWDWERGPAALRRMELDEPIHAVVALPDGRLATGGREARVRIWETDPARLIEIARRTTGRELTPRERARFGAAKPVQKLPH